VVVLHGGNTLSTPEVGRTDSVFLLSGFGRSSGFGGEVVRFSFPTTVASAPNAIHAFELLETSGDPLGYFFVYGRGPSSYGPGDALGRRDPNFDYWFQEGVFDQSLGVSIPTLGAYSVALLIAAIAIHAMLMCGRNSQ
jgi:hypothetical protein